MFANWFNGSPIVWNEDSVREFVQAAKLGLSLSKFQADSMLEFLGNSEIEKFCIFSGAEDSLDIIGILVVIATIGILFMPKFEAVPTMVGFALQDQQCQNVNFIIQNPEIFEF